MGSIFFEAVSTFVLYLTDYIYVMARLLGTSNQLYKWPGVISLSNMYINVVKSKIIALVVILELVIAAKSLLLYIRVRCLCLQECTSQS